MSPAGRFLTTLVVLAALLGLGWWGWTVIRPRPVLDRARFDALTAAGRFESAEVVLTDHLRRVPNDPEASYLLAQLLLDQRIHPLSSFRHDCEA